MPSVLQKVHHSLEFRNKRPSAAHPVIYVTSSAHGYGIPELRGEMLRVGKMKIKDRAKMKEQGILPKGRILGTPVGVDRS